MIIGLIAALALQAATPGQGEAKTPDAKPGSTSAVAKPVPAKPAEDPNKPICRRERPVGSNIEQRVCKTKAQWDAEAEDAQNVTSRLQHQDH